MTSNLEKGLPMTREINCAVTMTIIFFSRKEMRHRCLVIHSDLIRLLEVNHNYQSHTVEASETIVTIVQCKAVKSPHLRSRGPVIFS